MEIDLLGWAHCHSKQNQVCVSEEEGEWILAVSAMICFCLWVCARVCIHQFDSFLILLKSIMFFKYYLNVRHDQYNYYKQRRILFLHCVLNFLLLYIFSSFSPIPFSLPLLNLPSCWVSSFVSGLPASSFPPLSFNIKLNETPTCSSDSLADS